MSNNLPAIADMTTSQLETARDNYAEIVATWAANGTESTLTRYTMMRASAVAAELSNRTK